MAAGDNPLRVSREHPFISTLTYWVTLTQRRPSDVVKFLLFRFTGMIFRSWDSGTHGNNPPPPHTTVREVTVANQVKDRTGEPELFPE